ncbi:hypothetical protein I5L01_14235 [Erythrobacter sp. YJ-T3-07]|uniref:hypothetical protein n=1 Tax=Erythrobacter sp. YJ-T3-07 TaxID=2793063 RepID=UPI0018D2AA42|nr:hypothetical protein [Erythrobacter sp. YJ-T3-07]MBH1945383.1 hypothetical protein [Erythrobacter sp. YJ-T3-07]
MTHKKQVNVIALAFATSLMTSLAACDAPSDRIEEDEATAVAEPETVPGTQPAASIENPEPATGNTVMPAEPAARNDPAGMSKQSSRPSAPPTVPPSASAVPKDADALPPDEHAGHDMDSMPGHEMDND